MMQHPFRNGLLALLVGAAAFVGTNAIPGATHINNPAFALVWGGIPLAGLVIFIVLMVVGVRRKVTARTAQSADAGGDGG
jgi:uncharacterized membrane protein